MTISPSAVCSQALWQLAVLALLSGLLWFGFRIRFPDANAPAGLMVLLGVSLQAGTQLVLAMIRSRPPRFRGQPTLLVVRNSAALGWVLGTVGVAAWIHENAYFWAMAQGAVPPATALAATFVAASVRLFPPWLLGLHAMLEHHPRWYRDASIITFWAGLSLPIVVFFVGLLPGAIVELLYGYAPSVYFAIPDWVGSAIDASTDVIAYALLWLLFPSLIMTTTSIALICMTSRVELRRRSRAAMGFFALAWLGTVIVWIPHVTVLASIILTAGAWFLIIVLGRWLSSHPSNGRSPAVPECSASGEGEARLRHQGEGPSGK